MPDTKEIENKTQTKKVTTQKDYTPVDRVEIISTITEKDTKTSFNAIKSNKKLTSQH
jgi:hypothetical protein